MSWLVADWISMNEVIILAGDTKVKLFPLCMFLNVDFMMYQLSSPNIVEIV